VLTTTRDLLLSSLQEDFEDEDDDEEEDNVRSVVASSSSVFSMTTGASDALIKKGEFMRYRIGKTMIKKKRREKNEKLKKRINNFRAINTRAQKE
jgi:hypothetical protein